jgi:hypothetical protein
VTADGWAPAPRAQRTNPLAIAALVCGIVQFCGLFPAGIVAIIFGHLARRQIRRTGEQGWGLAKAGLILGYLVLAGTLLVAVLLLVSRSAAPARP